MKPNALTAAAIAVIGAGAFLAGRASVNPPESTTTDSSRHAPGSSRSASSSEGRSGSDSTATRGSGTSGNSRNATTSAFGTTKEERLAKLEEIIRGDDPIARNRAFLAYLDQLDPMELQDAVARFRALGITEERMSEYGMLLAAWSKSDPTAALTYARENTRGDFAIQTILSTWAASDPESALRWAKANHEGEEANPFLIGIIRGIAGSDPARATQLLTEMPFSEERGEALAGILPHILAKGNEATREWIASLTDPKLKDGAIGRVVDQLAQSDPKGTADWLLSNPGEAANRNMDNVLSAWMDKDSAAATAYYEALPAGETRSNALRGVVNSMALDNPQAAANYLDRHSSDSNDRVIQQFVWHAQGEDPALAMSYIGKMTNSGERDGTYRRMIDGWLRRDEAAARAWIQANPLPPSVQGHAQRALERLNQRGQ